MRAAASKASRLAKLVKVTKLKSRLSRREVHYSGHVQGVGFRYTTRGIAQRFQVTGFVRNLEDGRVQLVVEGEGTELEGFLSKLEREMARYIHDVQVNSSEPTREFDEFAIRT